MKTQLESIRPNIDSSFHLLRNDYLSDTFLWHFHPEYELVYIDNASGTRHVGDHLSSYQEDDLVFIGSNIPHLNFDYGVKTDYNNIVLHIHPNFLKNVLSSIPELESVKNLFIKSQHGLAFPKETVREIGEKMKKLHYLAPYERFIEVMNIFKVLALTSNLSLLHAKPYINKYSYKEQDRLRKIYEYVENNYSEKITIRDMATLCHLTNEAFCRYFKKVTGHPFTVFLNQYRISKAKTMLMSGKNVSETCFNCGFESLSYFNRTFKKITHEKPSSFKTRRKA